MAQTTLANIEDKINQSFDECFAVADASPLQTIITELENSKDGDAWTTYWLSYANVSLGIYLMEASKENSENALNAFTEAIDVLKDKDDKNTEEYTLLARAMSISISVRPAQAMMLSNKSKTYINKAMKLNDQNLRAYLQSGSSDYYTPKEYGGGNIAEAQFLKALSLPDKAINDEAAPAWGREEIYYMLVSFYLREEKYDKAKVYLKKGLDEFPDNQRLASLSAKI
ncbi:MAG: hypothetical protein CMO01_23650 [Thalassobius sp.]|nr:hypothetical protein [Thalassovita sp.]